MKTLIPARKPRTALAPLPTIEEIENATLEQLPVLIETLERELTAPASEEQAAQAATIILSTIPTSDRIGSIETFTVYVVQLLQRRPWRTYDGVIRRLQRKCRWTPSLAEIREAADNIQYRLEERIETAKKRLQKLESEAERIEDERRDVKWQEQLAQAWMDRAGDLEVWLSENYPNVAESFEVEKLAAIIEEHDDRVWNWRQAIQNHELWAFEFLRFLSCVEKAGLLPRWECKVWDCFYEYQRDDADPVAIFEKFWRDVIREPCSVRLQWGPLRLGRGLLRRQHDFAARTKKAERRRQRPQQAVIDAIPEQ